MKSAQWAALVEVRELVELLEQPLLPDARTAETLRLSSEHPLVKRREDRTR